MSATNPISGSFVSGEAARLELRQHHPARVFIAASDIDKDVHMIYIGTLAGEVLLPPTKVSSLAEGYALTKGRIDRHLHSGAFDLAVLGNEPTGIYHLNWSQRLVQDYHRHRIGQAQPAVRYRWLNPALVKEERLRKSHRRRKSDKIDVVAIFNLLSEGQGYPAPVFSQAETELRLTLRHVDHLRKRQMRLAIGRLRSLDRLWPGALGNSRAYARTYPELPPLLHLVDSRALERVRLRLLLEQCPDPHRLRQLGVDGIRDLFHQHGQRCGQATAEQILAVAEQSLLPPAGVTAILAQQMQADFAAYLLTEEQIEAGEARAVALLPATSGQVLTTFPGMSPLLTARYLAGIGDPDRFATARHLWAYAGYDPVQADSGNSRFTGRISHRGSPYLRKTLYQIGFLASRHCPDCVRTYNEARQQGLPVTKAVIHVANKANRILFALLKSQQPYRSPLAANEEIGWRQRAMSR